MTKIISVSDEAYEKLSSIKGQDSFTKIILKIINETTNKERLLSFFGSNSLDEKKIQNLKEDWNKWSERYA